MSFFSTETDNFDTYVQLLQRIHKLEQDIRTLEKATLMYSDDPRWEYGHERDTTVSINQVVNQLKQHIGVHIKKIHEQVIPSHLTIEKVKK
jgi:ABC-type uncharacterized transport system fused permease/ATPase subunit